LIGNLTIDDIIGEGSHSLTPIACKFCDPPSKYVTYIEFDLVLHLHEAHRIGRGFLDTQPTPSKPSRSWISDYRIRDAINEGKELGAELDDNSIERLDMEYSKYLDFKASIPAMAYEEVGVRPWSQRAKPFSFIPIEKLDEFFRNDHDKPYSALSSHQLESSPCYPIIGAKTAGRFILYWCEICKPEFGSGTNIHLSSIEHHCKYYEGDRHRVEILSRLEDLVKAVKGDLGVKGK
jgi:hypothetical protein